MEITSENFQKELPNILETISKADFFAIDCELSGLSISDDKDNYFETVNERYKVIKDSAKQFLVFQFGLCAFKYNPSSDSFTYKSFNFYTFPKQLNSNSPNIRFLCESSSLDFLSNNQFDFNKLIYHGIPYLTYRNEKKMREDYEKKLAYYTEDNSTVNTPLSVPENQKKFYNDIVHQLKTFISNRETKEIKLENLTPFQRKLIFHNLKPKYSNHLYFETLKYGEEENEGGGGDDGNTMKPSSVNVNNRNRILRIVKLSEAEQLERDNDKKQFEMDLISKNVGFSKVIREISSSGKLVVGHNMLLDIGHSVDQFIDEIPDTLEEFKILVQNTFPNLIDTKLMSVCHPFKDLIQSSVLFELLKRLQEDPFKLPVITKDEASQNDYTLNDTSKMHEAGYDAFVTGICFIGLCQFLGTLQNPPKSTCVLPESPIVLPFLNKLFLMRMLDISYLNISGTDLTPSRSHVFHVTCPNTSTVKDIQNIFSPFGTIQIWWRNSTSLFVSLNDKDQSNLVLRNIQYKNNYKVIPFETYQKVKANEDKLHSAAANGDSYNSNSNANNKDKITNKKQNDLSKKEIKKKKDEKKRSKKVKRPKTELSTSSASSSSSNANDTLDNKDEDSRDLNEVEEIKGELFEEQAWAN